MSLEQKLEEINERTKRIEIKINKIEQSIKHMDGHIDFVESVYDVVKKPFVSLLSLYSDEMCKIKTLDANHNYSKIITYDESNIFSEECDQLLVDN